uniref:NADH-ubiquinone oxidoreductase chain 3 n=1 Tax=Mezira sp. TaxID=2931906 RepID=A0A8T9W0L3_9HEMI|nr:NADH dehydrogenase subunit 3 [Mezira sp.]
MMLIMMALIITMVISMTLMLLCFLVSSKSKYDREKSSPFECGFDPMSSPRKPFSIQFFLIGILFVVFDVEITIILPLIFLMKYSLTWNWIMVMSSFMIILILGLYFEWKNGALMWMN